MKHLILFGLLFLSFMACMEPEEKHGLVLEPGQSFEITVSPNKMALAILPPDADCDGVTDSLDVCPGINDKIDNNNDGKPDCKFPPTYNKVITAWKCGTPTLQKVFVCFKTNSGGTITICTPYAAVNTHIAAGNRLGVCGSSKCGSGQ